MALALAAAAPGAVAGAYPERPIRLIVAFPAGEPSAGGTPEQLAADIASELQRWTPVVKALGIKLE